MNSMWRRGKFSQLRQVVPYGKSKIQQLVSSGAWKEGLHFVTDHSGDRLYNLDLLADWVTNINDPSAHDRAIELYVSSLPSNLLRKRKTA